MEDIEICTHCHQSFEISFHDRFSGYVLTGEIFFFCQNCYNLLFDKTFNYENGIPNGHLELPSTTLEFMNKEGYKIEIITKGYIFESIKQMNIDGTLLYEKYFLSFGNPKHDFKDIRNYVVRKYYDNGLLKHESFRVGICNTYREEFTNYSSPIKEWYPNGVLHSEKLPNVSEKVWDDEGYLLIDNEKGDKTIRRKWYKDIDMCLYMSDYLDYYGDDNTEIYVIDRNGNKYNGAFDKLDNLVPYILHKETNTCEFRILNNQYDNLYRTWFHYGIITNKIFHKYKKWLEWSSNNIELNGNYNIYNLKGILVEEVSYEKDKLNGIYRKRDWMSGVLVKEYYFEKNRYNGVFREWSLGGVLLKEHTYMKNKFNGLCREWSISGILLKEHNYKDHKLEGLCNEYYENGELDKTGIFKNGKCVNENRKKVFIKKMETIIFNNSTIVI